MIGGVVPVGGQMTSALRDPVEARVVSRGPIAGGFRARCAALQDALGEEQRPVGSLEDRSDLVAVAQEVAIGPARELAGERALGHRSGGHYPLALRKFRRRAISDGYRLSGAGYQLGRHVLSRLPHGAPAPRSGALCRHPVEHAGGAADRRRARLRGRSPRHSPARRGVDARRRAWRCGLCGLVGVLTLGPLMIY